MTGTRRDNSVHQMAGVIMFGVRDGHFSWARFYLEQVQAGEADVNEAVRLARPGRSQARAGIPAVIVVAGGTGTLGTRLVPHLAGAGVAVRVLTRDPARARHLAAPGVEVARGDVRDAASVGRAVRGAGRWSQPCTASPGPVGSPRPRWTGPETHT